MIVFCEDCGAKNELEAKQVVDGIAGFRCGTCNYLNAYPVPLKKGTPLLDRSGSFSENEQDPAGIAMEALKEINRFPHVIGSFLFHYDKGIPFNAMPEVLGEKELLAIGEVAAKNYYAGLAAYPDIRETTLAFKKRGVVARSVSGKLFIAVLSDALPMPPEFTELLDRVEKRLAALYGRP